MKTGCSAVMLGVLTLSLFAGCGSDAGQSPEGDSQAASDQYILERASTQMLSECREAGRVEPQDIMVAAVKIIDHRANETLPNGATAQDMANQIVADIKRCGTLDAEFVEMMFTPGSGETSFEQERREHDEMLAGEAEPSQPLFQEICRTIIEKGEDAAERQFVNSTPYGDLARARAAFPEIAAACSAPAH